MKRLALLAVAGLLTIGLGSTADAGLFSGLFDHGDSCCRPKRSCCQPVRCCAPAPTCCTPQPTCCAPKPTCCAPAPSCAAPAPPAGKVAPKVPYEETPPPPRTEAPVKKAKPKKK